MHKNPIWHDFLLGGAAILAAGFIGTRIVRPSAEQVIATPQGMTIAQQDKIDEAASASLFGSFRTSIADFLWLKVDKYTHNGVEIRGLTTYEKKTSEADAVHTTDSDVKQGFKQHTGETTVIPSAQRDWRGRLGDIEREVQPYADMAHHTHRDPKEALPLFRLMTRANPKFIPGYTYGAAMIARDKTKYPEAMAFLAEGERNNPNSIEIKAEFGDFYVAKLRQYAKAEPYLKRALEIAASRDQKTFTEDENDAYEEAFRWLILAYRYQGRREEAHDLAVACLKKFPDDAVSRKQLEIERNGEWRTYIDK